MQTSNRKILIGGNWKSNGTIAFTKEIIGEMINHLSFDTSKIDVLVCPTFLHLSIANAMVNEEKAKICA